MRPFLYEQPASTPEAIGAAARHVPPHGEGRIQALA